MTRVWLVRHGQPVEEARGRCYGALDVRLSEAGRDQIALDREFLKGEPAAAIYSGPSARAMESARMIADAHGLPVEPVEGFREMNFGDFEGLTYDEIAARYPETYRRWMQNPTEVRFPNGESLAEMRARVLSAFEAILSGGDGRTTIIVSHGGVNRIVLAWALGMPPKNIFRIAQDYAAINLLTIMEGWPAVQLMNCRASVG